MSRIKPERAHTAEHFQSFGGLGSSLLAKERKASDMQNLRISSDGSLQKRTGYRLLYNLPDTVYAYWEGSINQTFYQFAICRNDIYRIDPSTGSTTWVGSRKDTANTHPEFVFFNDSLYLPEKTGMQMFNVYSNYFEKIQPYIPLYGKNWDPQKGGSVNEPFNLLTNTIRVHYLNASNASTFFLPFFATCIHSVSVDGVPTSDFTFDFQSNRFTLGQGLSAINVEVGFEVMLTDDPDGIQSCTRGTVYPGQHHSTMCLYQSNIGYRIYCSSNVSQLNLESCRRTYVNAQNLYFTDYNVLFLGDSQTPITAIRRYGNRLLAHSDSSTWELLCPDDTEEYVQVSALLPGIGCTAPYSAILCNGLPLIVNQRGVFQIKFSASGSIPPEEIRISSDIETLLPKGFFERCIAREDSHHNELWMRDPNDDYGRVFVYHYVLKEWYVFTNFYTSLFLDFPNFHGFAYYGKLYAFDQTLYTDHDQAIDAFYQSGYFDFSHPEAQKRSLRVISCVDIEEDSASLKLETENADRTFRLPYSKNSSPEFFDIRTIMGRFRFLRFRIHLSGKKACRIYSLSFYANL